VARANQSRPRARRQRVGRWARGQSRALDLGILWRSGRRVGGGGGGGGRGGGRGGGGGMARAQLR
jgi:hypothetical protein